MVQPPLGITLHCFAHSNKRKNLMSIEQKQTELSMLKHQVIDIDNLNLLRKAILGDDAAKASLQTIQDKMDSLETDINAGS